MNHHVCWISVPILYRITLQNVPYMDFNLLGLTSFEVTIVTTMNSQGPTVKCGTDCGMGSFCRLTGSESMY